MKPLADQCGSLGWKMEELLGRTAREVKSLGFEVPSTVPDEHVLRSDAGVEALVNISTQGRLTGYAWVRPWGANGATS